MATAHVQTVTAAWSTGSTIIANITATNGNLLIVSVHLHAGNSTNTIVGVSDDVNGAYSISDVIEDTTLGDHWALGVFYFKNITGGAITVTATLQSAVVGDARIVVEEASGCDTTAPLDVHVAAEQTGPGPGTDAVTSTAVTGQAGGYVFGATEAFAGGPTITHGTGFTDGMNVVGRATEYIENYAGGSQAATFTTSVGGAVFMTAVAIFKSAGGGGGAVLHAAGLM